MASTVATPRGQIAARNVIVATNGYSGPAIPAIRQRLLPIKSYMLATERLSPNQVAQSCRTDGPITTTRRRSHFFTVADERAAHPDGRPDRDDPPLGTWATLGAAGRRHRASSFPSSARCPRSPMAGRGAARHPWTCFPRFGELDGMHYALGYSFSGMAMGPHLARKVALSILTGAPGP
jgi:glycine/D-amino acid oxidase-like deaminating enzyme